MADSPREAALKALHELLKTLPTAPKVGRNTDETQSIPAEGLIVMRDGDSGEPEIYLSPPSYAYAHQAEIVVQVKNNDQAVRDAALDALLQKVGAALASNPTLGGKVDMATPDAPTELTEGLEAETIKAALVVVTLDYVSATPLG